MKWTVYCLADAITHEVYYVGCSMSLEGRMKQHWAAGGSRKNRTVPVPGEWRSIKDAVRRREALMARAREGLENVIPMTIGVVDSESEANALETAALLHFLPPCNKIKKTGGYKKTSSYGKMPSSWRLEEFPAHPLADTVPPLTA